MKVSLDFIETPNQQQLLIMTKRRIDYMKRKKISKAKSNELNKMKEDIDNVKGELGEIKGFYLLLFKN